MFIKKPPIVIVLGHIDHGKTTLLDAIRKTNIALKEAGGITQKIGAYEIFFNDEKITFIDTPGHEAFNKLRKRGVRMADIGILVIAADEGVKEQTKESLEYLKTEKIPFIVALTKIDKKESDPQKVISQLIELEVMPEKWGGEVPLLEISAPKNQGLNDLLETIILIRDIHDFKTDLDKPGRGFILEVFKDARRGILASAVVVEGKVNYGDCLITKSAFCKIRIFEDDLGKKINLALPSKPFIVGNFDFPPLVGEEFIITDIKDKEKIQKELKRKEDFKEKIIFKIKDASSDYFLILKADNIGSLEALENVFQKIAQDEHINLKIIKADIGAITFEDLDLAKETNAFLISFNVPLPKQILDFIKNLNLKLFESKVIYELEKNFLEYLKQLRESEFSVKGDLEVLATFGKTKTKKTIGGRVMLGKLKINQKVSILRNNEKIGQGKIISLEKNKIPVDEVNEGDLCGLIIETSKDIEINDHLMV